MTLNIQGIAASSGIAIAKAFRLEILNLTSKRNQLQTKLQKLHA